MATVVIGAGIIGTAIAHDLQERGRQVVLADRDAPGKGASFGNMAPVAVTEFMPASRPTGWCWPWPIGSRPLAGGSSRGT